MPRSFIDLPTFTGVGQDSNTTHIFGQHWGLGKYLLNVIESVSSWSPIFWYVVHLLVYSGCYQDLSWNSNWLHTWCLGYCKVHYGCITLRRVIPRVSLLTVKGISFWASPPKPANSPGTGGLHDDQPLSCTTSSFGVLAFGICSNIEICMFPDVSKFGKRTGYVN